MSGNLRAVLPPPLKDQLVLSWAPPLFPIPLPSGTPHGFRCLSLRQRQPPPAPPTHHPPPPKKTPKKPPPPPTPTPHPNHTTPPPPPPPPHQNPPFLLSSRLRSAPPPFFCGHSPDREVISLLWAAPVCGLRRPNVCFPPPRSVFSALLGIPSSPCISISLFLNSKSFLFAPQTPSIDFLAVTQSLNSSFLSLTATDWEFFFHG